MNGPDGQTAAIAGKRRNAVRRLLLGLIAAVLALGAWSSPALAADGSTHYYLALGDSLAMGFQPDLYAQAYRDDGYVALLHQRLAASDPKLELENVSCGGETTISMIDGSQPPDVALSCGSPNFYRHWYPHKTQLAEAVNFLAGHKGKVSLVTIDIGGNDPAFCFATGSSTCFEAALATMTANLDTILDELQAAAPGVPIVGMTYYDPFGCLWFTGPEGQAQALALSGLVQALNAALTSVYAAHGVAVADVAGAFSVGSFPDDAYASLNWTWFCSADHPGDVHPNDAGYQVIADAFLHVVAP
jgi:lysophospholipase L1-like esterase